MMCYRMTVIEQPMQISLEPQNSVHPSHNGFRALTILADHFRRVMNQIFKPLINKLEPAAALTEECLQINH